MFMSSSHSSPGYITIPSIQPTCQGFETPSSLSMKTRCSESTKITTGNHPQITLNTWQSVHTTIHPQHLKEPHRDTCILPIHASPFIPHGCPPHSFLSLHNPWSHVCFLTSSYDIGPLPDSVVLRRCRHTTSIRPLSGICTCFSVQWTRGGRRCSLRITRSGVSRLFSRSGALNWTISPIRSPTRGSMRPPRPSSWRSSWSPVRPTRGHI